jgi:hypothetical protein
VIMRDALKWPHRRRRRLIGRDVAVSTDWPPGLVTCTTAPSREAGVAGLHHVGAGAALSDSA